MVFMRKYIVLLLAIMLVFSTLTVSADTGIVDSMEFQGNVTELSLDGAIAAMLKDNPTIAKAKLDLDQAGEDYDKSSRQLRETKKTVNRISDNSYMRDTDPNSYSKTLDQIDSSDLETAASSLEVTMKYAKDNAQSAYDATVNGVKADIEQSYYQLLQAQQLQNISNDNMNVFKDLYDKTKSKFDLGLVAKQEVLNSELNYVKSQSDYNAAVNSVKSAQMAFNAKLGYDVMSNVKLTDGLTYKEFKLDSIAKSVENALQNRYDLKAAEYGYEMEKANLASVAAKYPEITYNYQTEKIKLDKAAKDYANCKKAIEMEVRSNYLAITQKQQEYLSGQKSVELAQEALKISQLQYNAGMAVQTDVQKAQIALQQAQVALSQTLLDYNLAVLKFQDSIGVGRKQ